MSVKKLIEKAPELCGAKYAKKLARVASLVWEDEKKNNGFPRIKEESALDRVEFLFDFRCDDECKKDYCKKLCELNVLSHYASEHGDHEAGIKAIELKEQLKAVEADYPDVAEVLTVEVASRGWWGD